MRLRNRRRPVSTARFSPDRQGRTGIEAIKAAYPDVEVPTGKRKIRKIDNPNEKRGPAPWRRIERAAIKAKLPVGTNVTLVKLRKLIGNGNLPEVIQMDLAIHRAAVVLRRIDSHTFRLDWR